MSVSQKLSLSFVVFLFGTVGCLVSLVLGFYYASLFLLGLLGVFGSTLIITIACVWRSKLTASLHPGTFEFQREVGRSFPSDEERMEAIRRTQEAMRPPEGSGVETEIGAAINLYRIYYNLLKDILTNVHGGKLKPSDSRESGLLNARVTHLKNCPDCQRLLGYVATEMQKLLPVENKEVEA